MDSELELMRELVSALPDSVFVLTESGRYALIGGGGDPVHYPEVARLTGLSLHDVLEPGYADWFLDQVHATLDQDGMRTVDYCLAGSVRLRACAIAASLTNSWNPASPNFAGTRTMAVR